jgi:signal transduction histidine kinase
MKPPWPLWSLLSLSVLVVAGAMAWLTIKACEVDRAERVARAERDREADAGRALWRMDALLAPLLAEEAVRPHWAYAPVLRVSDGKSPRRILSPIVRPPQFVRMHFTLRPDNTLGSPQCPAGDDRAWGLQQMIGGRKLTAAELDASELLRLELAKSLKHSGLLAKLPAQTLPAEGSEDVMLLGNSIVFQNGMIQNGPNAYGFQNNPSQQTDPAMGNNSAAYSNSITNPNSESQLKDFRNRGQAAQNYAVRTRGVQQMPLPGVSSLPDALEGPSQPLWIGSKLIVARRTRVKSETLIEGCWLDWDLLQVRLKTEVAEIFPGLDLVPLQPADAADPNRLLATLPVRIAPPPLRVEPATGSPLRWALTAAWAGLLLAGLAAAVTLHNIIALSERRAAFVSAVTHELRTPLTTFRLYADMLAGGLVVDDARRQEYLETLRREADRLAHLVDNVLQYARLERGRPGGRREPHRVADLLNRIVPRLTDRARQAGMTLDVIADIVTREDRIVTDAQAVEQILFNLVDNAAKYAAHSPSEEDRRVTLDIRRDGQAWKLRVQDRGPGVPHSIRRRLFQPFCKPAEEAARTAPGVGLGLALSRRLATDLGGRLELDGGDNGARFTLTLPV